MPPRFKPDVSTELLVWARESARLSVEAAAKKAGLKAHRLEAFEAGDDRPTLKQLVKLARTYQRPLGVFCLSSPPKDFDTKLRDFRRLATAEARAHSSELELQIRRSLARRELALELYRELEDEDPPKFPLRARLSDDPEQVGLRIREHLAVTTEKQQGWSSTSDALRNWRIALERANVLVFQAVGVEPNEVRGFSISEQPFPAVVTNTKDAPAGRIFTLFHELAHVMLNDGGLCDFYDRGSSHDRRIEAFCNRVAAATLLPRDAFLSDPLVVAKAGPRTWTNEELTRLSRRFRVSRQAILIRLITFGRATQTFYDRKKREFDEDWLKYREELKKSEGGPSYPARTVARDGRLFIRLILSSYDAENITSSDVSDYLGVKLRHLPQIREEVYETSS